MKKAKRLVSLLLAIVMLLSLAVGVGAAGETPTETPTVPDPVFNQGAMEGPLPADDKLETDGGSIKITNAAPSEEYNIYQMLYLESYDDSNVKFDETLQQYIGGVYSYKVNSQWETFFATDAAKDYFTVDNKGYATWKKTSYTGTDVVNFTQMAINYAKTTNITPVYTVTIPGKSTDAAIVYTFGKLKLGYYLIDTSLGSLCTLNTVKDEIDLTDKNMIPKNEKFVYQSGWKKESDQQIGNDVYYMNEITYKSGISKLIFHDKMTDGLTFKSDTVKVVLDQTAQTPADTGRAKSETLVLNKHYKIVTDPDLIGEADEKCTFHIEFLDKFYEEMLKLTGNHKLTITYQAELNEQAVGVDNVNTSKVSYGEKNHFTADSTTTTKTWEVPFYKYTTEQSTTKGLSDTHFILSTQANVDMSTGTEPEKIKLVEVSDGKNSDDDPTNDVQAVYRIATPEEIASVAADKPKVVEEIITNGSGLFKIQGFDSTTYCLYETQAKEGYNKLDTEVTIVVKEDGTFDKNESSVAGAIGIVNNSGTVLPSTGGIGTTIFYIAGSVLLVGAAILLIVKKRMKDGE